MIHDFEDILIVIKQHTIIERVRVLQYATITVHKHDFYIQR